jgi:hypothetical protein
VLLIQIPQRKEHQGSEVRQRASSPNCRSVIAEESMMPIVSSFLSASKGLMAESSKHPPGRAQRVEDL